MSGTWPRVGDYLVFDIGGANIECPDAAIKTVTDNGNGSVKVKTADAISTSKTHSAGVLMYTTGRRDLLHDGPAFTADKATVMAAQKWKL